MNCAIFLLGLFCIPPAAPAADYGTTYYNAPIQVMPYEVPAYYKAPAAPRGVYGTDPDQRIRYQIRRDADSSEGMTGADYLIDCVHVPFPQCNGGN